jgi:hypothetical protein
VGLSAPLLLPYPVPRVSASSGTISSSCTIQRRCVSPAARAGVRCLLALGHALPTVRARLPKPDTQRLVWADEVILGRPPFQMQQQLGRVLHRRPGAADKGRHTLPQRQVNPLDKRGVHPPAQPQSNERRSERSVRPTAHHLAEPHQLPPLIGLLHLAVD